MKAMNRKTPYSSGNILRKLASGENIDFASMGVIYRDTEQQRESAKAWSFYAKAMTGKLYQARIDAAKKDANEQRLISVVIQDLKGEYYGHKGRSGTFVPDQSHHSFFSKCSKYAMILEAYGSAFFFNGNVPFSQLGDISTIDYKLFECAQRVGMTEKYQRISATLGRVPSNAF